MNIENVSLSEILAAARVQQASLVPESSGFIILGIGRCLGGLPLLVEPSSVLLSTEGLVALAGVRQPVEMTVASDRLRQLLAALLEVSIGSLPALRLAAHDATPRNLEELLADVSAGLIPLNRGAAKRALARLARETVRAKNKGMLAQVEPLQLSTEQPVASPPNTVATSASSQPAPASTLPAGPPPASPPPPAAPSMSNAAANTPNTAREDDPPDAGRTTSPHEEPTPTWIDPDLETEHQSASADEPIDEAADEATDEPGDEPQTSYQHAEQPPARLDGVPAAPPAAPSPVVLPPALPAPHEPFARRSAAANYHGTVAAMLDDFGEAKAAQRAPYLSSAVQDAANEFKRFADLQPNPARRDSFEPGELDSLLPPQAEDLTPREAQFEAKSIPPQAYDPRPPRAPRATLWASGALLVAGLLAVGGLWWHNPAFFAGSDSPLARTRDAERPATGHATDRAGYGQVAKLTLRNLPTPHEILVRLGAPPLDTRPLPTGVRLELVVTAPGHATKRIIIPADAPWTVVGGRRIHSLEVNLEPTTVDRWPEAPAGVVGGIGPAGILRVNATPTGTELWLVVAVGEQTSAKVPLYCDADAHLLVVNPREPANPRRVTVQQSLLRAAAQTGHGELAVYP